METGSKQSHRLWVGVQWWFEVTTLSVLPLSIPPFWPLFCSALTILNLVLVHLIIPCNFANSWPDFFCKVAECIITCNYCPFRVSLGSFFYPRLCQISMLLFCWFYYHINYCWGRWGRKRASVRKSNVATACYKMSAGIIYLRPLLAPQVSSGRNCISGQQMLMESLRSWTDRSPNGKTLWGLNCTMAVYRGSLQVWRPSCKTNKQEGRKEGTQAFS